MSRPTTSNSNLDLAPHGAAGRFFESSGLAAWAQLDQREIEAEVHTFRQLWDRRIGTVHRHDPQPWHAKPIERLPPKRSKRGFRGAGVKDDPWVRGAPES